MFCIYVHVDNVLGILGNDPVHLCSCLCWIFGSSVQMWQILQMRYDAETDEKTWRRNTSTFQTEQV